MQQGFLEHIQLGAGRFHGRLAHTASAGLRVDWGEYNLPVNVRGNLVQHMVSFGILISGASDWRAFGSNTGNEDLLILPEAGELQLQLPKDSKWLSLQVSRERLQALDIDLRGLSSCFGWRLAPSRFGSLRDCLTDLAPLLSPTGACGSGTGTAVADAHEVLFAALTSDLSWRLAGPDRARPTPMVSREAWRIVRRAEEHLRARGDLSIRIDDWCIACGTSISSLERAFRRVHGVGPRQYLSLRSFAAARRDLLNDGEAQGGPATVTAVATRWGFFHLGRFSLGYTRLFGESPSQTLRRARARA